MNGYGLAGGLGAALVVSLSLWFADHARQNSERLTGENEGMARELIALATALDSQAILRESLDKIDRQTLAITNALDGQTAQLNRNLVEMKRTDEKARAYLAELIPAALGLRYARPETTDPVAYRAGAVVQPGAVPASGSPAIAQ